LKVIEREAQPELDKGSQTPRVLGVCDDVDESGGGDDYDF
jgi:hypothetical protein